MDEQQAMMAAIEIVKQLDAARAVSSWENPVDEYGIIAAGLLRFRQAATNPS